MVRDTTFVSAALCSSPGEVPVTIDRALHSKQSLTWQLLVEFSLSIGPGSEHQVAKHVTEAIRDLGLSLVQMERVRQAIVEALCYAMTRGNQGQQTLAVSIRVWVAGVHAQECSRSGPEATQSGQQKYRGWASFLVQKQGDNPQASDPESRHMVELFLYREGALATEQTSVKDPNDFSEVPPTDRQRQRE
jgi:hypothetical protein